MSVSIKEHFKFAGTQEEIELKRFATAVLADLTELRATIVANKALYDAHTHESPGSTHAASRGSTPDTGAAENSLAASAASAFETPAALNLVT